MIVRFAVVCDRCGTRGEEYGGGCVCTGCDRDVCETCSLTRDEESGRARCADCGPEDAERRREMRMLTGTVVGQEGSYIRVVVPGDPLSPLLLTPMEANGARPGDRVELVYRTTPSSGLWVVVRVLR